MLIIPCKASTASRGHWVETGTSALLQPLLVLPSTQEGPKGFTSVLAHHTLEPWPHCHDKVAALGTEGWVNMDKHHLCHQDASPCASMWQDPPASP